MKKLIIGSLATVFSVPAFAGGSWTGVTVTAIQACMQAAGGSCASPTNLVQVQLSANSTGGPACATNKGWVAVDVTTAVGGAALSAFQYAKAAGTTVNITGAGTCISGSTIENLSIVLEQ